MRETFFANQQASAGYTVEYAGYKSGDFRIGVSIIIEVGGADIAIFYYTGAKEANSHI